MIHALKSGMGALTEDQKITNKMLSRIKKEMAEYDEHKAEMGYKFLSAKPDYREQRNEELTKEEKEQT